MKKLLFFTLFVSLIACTKDTGFEEKDKQPGKIVYVAYIGGETVDCCIFDGAETILSIPPEYNSNIKWSTGETGDSIIIDTPGIYSIDSGFSQVTYFDCRHCEYEISVPEAFTPNGDGINDALFIIYKGVINLKADFYNDKARKIFEQSGLYNYWDGRDMDGNRLAAGNYFYIIQAKFLNEETREFSGSVQLIR